MLSWTSAPVVILSVSSMSTQNILKFIIFIYKNIVPPQQDMILTKSDWPSTPRYFFLVFFDSVFSHSYLFTFGFSSTKTKNETFKLHLSSNHLLIISSVFQAENKMVDKYLPPGILHCS